MLATEKKRDFKIKPETQQTYSIKIFKNVVLKSTMKPNSFEGCDWCVLVNVFT